MLNLAPNFNLEATPTAIYAKLTLNY